MHLNPRHPPLPRLFRATLRRVAVVVCLPLFAAMACSGPSRSGEQGVGERREVPFEQIFELEQVLTLAPANGTTLSYVSGLAFWGPWIVVSDAEEGRVFVFDAEGAGVMVLGEKIGEGGADLRRPWRAVELPDGNLAVLDRDLHEVRVFDRSGRWVGGFAFQGDFAGDLILTPEGDLVVMAVEPMGSPRSAAATTAAAAADGAGQAGAGPDGAGPEPSAQVAHRYAVTGEHLGSVGDWGPDPRPADTPIPGVRGALTPEGDLIWLRVARPELRVEPGYASRFSEAGDARSPHTVAIPGFREPVVPDQADWRAVDDWINDNELMLDVVPINAGILVRVRVGSESGRAMGADEGRRYRYILASLTDPRMTVVTTPVPDVIRAGSGDVVWAVAPAGGGTAELRTFRVRGSGRGSN
jgi:hypothetical protein